MTLVGFIVSVALLITKHKPQKYGYCWHFKVGKDWGGVSLGLIIITDTTPTTHTTNHEHGHALQNIRYGIAMVPLSLMSAARYCTREIQYRIGKPPKTDYDAWWFEGEATKLGTDFMFNFYK